MSENNLVISIDAMGGDNSPRVVIEGLAIAARKNPDVRFLLFGDEAKIRASLGNYPQLQKVCEIRHSDEVVRNEDKPSSVIRNKNTSMYMAIDAVRKGEAQAVVSAGNTGALMAISKLVLKTIQKIHRPAIVSVMPHINGKYVMLDLGANTECSAINLGEFAMMGDILARCALGISRPRVALLNIGAEEMKGKEEIHKAAQMIRNSHMNIDFIGYIEPHEIPNDKADVIVADGGNDCKKTASIACREYTRAELSGKKCIILATEQTKSRYSGKRHVVIGDRTQPQTLCAALFRELRNESRGMDLIIAESVPAEAQGLAYMNRLLRAAGFTVISE